MSVNILTNSFVFLLGVSATLMAPLSHALYINNDEIIDIDGYEFSLWARDNSVGNVLSGGSVKYANIADNATMNVLGGEVYSLSIAEGAQVSISSARVSKIWAFGDSEITLDNVRDLSSLRVFGRTSLEILGTDLQFDGSFLSGFWSDGSYFNIQAYAGNATLINGYSGSFSGHNSASTVPVPASAWLFCSAVVGLGVVGRKRKSSHCH